MARITNKFLLQGDVEQVAYIQHIPELWVQPGTVLYVGANPIRFHCGPELHRFGHEITLLEIWPANCAAFRGYGPVAHVVEGDVRAVARLALPHPTYDVVLWWHGPEHVRRAEVGPTVRQLEALTQRVVVLGCPWGEYPQGTYPNPYEAHLCALYPEDLTEWGYQVHEMGAADDPATGRLVGWKVRGDA